MAENLAVAGDVYGNDASLHSKSSPLEGELERLRRENDNIKVNTNNSNLLNGAYYKIIAEFLLFCGHFWSFLNDPWILILHFVFGFYTFLPQVVNNPNTHSVNFFPQKNPFSLSEKTVEIIESFSC